MYVLSLSVVFHLFVHLMLHPQPHIFVSSALCDSHLAHFWGVSYFQVHPYAAGFITALEALAFPFRRNQMSPSSFYSAVLPPGVETTQRTHQQVSTLPAWTTFSIICPPSLPFTFSFFSFSFMHFFSFLSHLSSLLCHIFPSIFLNLAVSVKFLSCSYLVFPIFRAPYGLGNKCEGCVLILLCSA